MTMKIRWVVLVFAVAFASMTAPAGAFIIDRLNVNPDGETANKPCLNPAISADGRYVAFATTADNMFKDDTKNTSDIFVYDRMTGLSECVTSSIHQGTSPQSTEPAISGDGRFVAFASTALVPGGADIGRHIYVYDRQQGTYELVSRMWPVEEGNPWDCHDPVLSSDGRYVAFRAAWRSSEYLCLRDRLEGRTENLGSGYTGMYGKPDISADGRYVAFSEGSWNVTMVDRLLQTSERVNVTTNDMQLSPVGKECSITADGRYVAFVRGGMWSQQSDIYVRDRAARRTELATPDIQQPIYEYTRAGEPNLSDDGRWVMFSVVFADRRSNIYLRDLLLQRTLLVTEDDTGETATGYSFGGVMSGDARFAAFDTDASDIFPGGDEPGEDLLLATLGCHDAPFVIAISPPDQAIGVAGTIVVEARFSELMDPATINRDTFKVVGRVSGPVAGSISYVSSRSIARFVPSSPLPMDSFTVTLLGGVPGMKDASGVAMASDYAWSFTRLSTDPPQVEITAPADGATVGGVVVLAATASSAAGIDRVVFYVDNVQVGTARAMPYQADWNTWPLTVSEGPHTIKVEAWDGAGACSVQAITVTVDNSTFDDVPKTSTIFPYVEALVREGIAAGCSFRPRLFCPQGSVSRAYLATFICRAAGWEPFANPSPTFADVPPTYRLYGYIEAFYQHGATVGCRTQPLCFCPNVNVTRAQMAMFLCRSSGIAPVDSPTPTFTDVPRVSYHYPYIEGIYAAGVAGGCGINPLRFCPGSLITRGEMAVMLCKAFGIETTLGAR